MTAPHLTFGMVAPGTVAVGLVLSQDFAKLVLLVFEVTLCWAVHLE